MDLVTNDIKPNSHRYKAEQKTNEREKKVEKVVLVKLLQRKRVVFVSLLMSLYLKMLRMLRLMY
jgi:hypothetical protein